MIPLYRRSFDALKSGWPFFLFVAAILIALETTFVKPGVSTLFGYGVVAMVTHRIVILGETYRWGQTFAPNAPDGARLPFIGFIIRYFAFFCVLILFGVGSMFLGLAPATAQVISFLAFALTLALFGNVLAATAVRGDTGFVAALRRGRAHFGRTVFNILAGPAVIGALGVLASMLPYLVAPDLPDALLRFFSVTLAVVIGLLSAVFLATALSLSYIDAETP